MDVWRITIAALRRWYILIPLLALTAFAVMAAGTQSAPEYEGRASAMLSPSRVIPDSPNPYSTINGAQEALALVLNSTDVRRQIASGGSGGSFEVGAAARSTIIQITTRAATAAAAEQTGQAVLDAAAEELATRQSDAGLREREQYTLEILEPPTVIAVVETSQVRVQAVVGVLGAALSVLVAVLFDDIIGMLKRARARRRRRRAERTPDDGDAEELALSHDNEHADQPTLDDIPVVELEPASTNGVTDAAVGSPRDHGENNRRRPRPRRLATVAGGSPHSSLLTERDQTSQETGAGPGKGEGEKPVDRHPKQSNPHDAATPQATAHAGAQGNDAELHGSKRHE